MPLSAWMMTLAALPPTITVLAYVGFALFNADRLQSEDFILQQQWFAAQIGDNTTRQVITVDAERGALTSNKAIIGGGDDG